MTPTTDFHPEIDELRGRSGRIGLMPAYCDHEKFVIHFREVPESLRHVLIGADAPMHALYMSAAGLPGRQPFISVLDALLGEGSDTWWREVQIVFDPRATPRQFVGDDEILAAAAEGEIALEATERIFRCTVVGTA